MRVFNFPRSLGALEGRPSIHPPESVPLSATIEPSDQTFARRIALAIVIGFLLLIALGVAGVIAVRQTQVHGELASNALRVESTLHRFSALTERLENFRRGYLLTGDPRYPSGLAELSPAADQALADAISSVSVDAVQERRLAELRTMSERHREGIARSMERRNADPNAAPQSLFEDPTGVPLLQEMRGLIADTVAYEQELVEIGDAEQARSQTVAYLVLAVSGVLLVLVAAASIWMARRNLLQLRRSRNVLRGMNEMLEGAVAVRTADLQRANAEIQRFAYIVSHDLRSPLVNVMGFTSELDAATGQLRDLVERAEREAPAIVTPEAVLAVREDLPEAIGFIRSSTQKMDRLINAILRLSREGRRVISPEPLAMEAVIGTIVDSLQHRLTETGSSVTVEGALPSIVSDRVAVEQIFSNLIENAVKYTRPGVPGVVRVRGRRVGARVVFEVEDNGRGIDPRDHDRVFDLFRRSGAQDRPGEGIGLAHVRAMAYRLGGTVSCESELDAGATFRLSVPETFQESVEG